MSTRTRRHTIRFSEAEWETLRQRALACSMPPGTFIREVSLGARPRQRRRLTEQRLLNQLARLGNNLNQIARLGNSGFSVPQSEIQALVRRLECLMEEF